jgi:PglZ domain
MDEQITFLDALTQTIQNASKYNQNDQVAPVAILWPDKDRQWQALLPLLRERLPLFTLGSYQPKEHTGPAYWLRCIIARTLPEHVLPPEVIPIIYLPGFSKQDIRAIEETPKVLQPLSELQYRGVLWTHKNGRDWTVSAFIQSRDGLGIEIDTDPTIKVALQRSLLKLADEPLARLKKEMPLRAAFFDALLHPDEVRNLLLWLNDSVAYNKRSTQAEWESFCDLCKRKYDFQPDKDGLIAAATLLAMHQGLWEIVWQRFKETPHAYPSIPEHLRAARPVQPSFFLGDPEVWPQDNESAEVDLRTRLVALSGKLPDEIRTGLYELEQTHGIRRTWVWATLGQSPLAIALQYLVTLAIETEHTLAGSTVATIVDAYTERGWQADAAVITALATIDSATTEDSAAVKTVITVLYRPWLEGAALAMQNAVSAGHPAQTYPVEHLPEVQNGTCLLFCDGLRYDVAQQLVIALQEQKLQCTVIARLAALPTITPTAKPAVSPVATLLAGKTDPGFAPVVSSSSTKVNAEVLQALLRQAGYQVLQPAELGDPSGRAWTELGTIDKSGHAYGWKLARQLTNEIDTLKRRIEALLSGGWKRVTVVTDHGWLLLPGHLPKALLPEHLTYQRKGRCAQLKELSSTDQQTVPWYWHRDVSVALAPGICCYEAGKEYEHGGLSP